ncbi:MAG: Rieske 2Fe-2S domain-containing protein [Burkholderiales bacterium]|nr:Rieske 2Fe-2S domain-containing protein [Burkholderiales bacterium]
MADAQRLICASDALQDAGAGVRFEVCYFGEPAPAFVVRWEGRVFGYLNRCAHMPMELDWLPGAFFAAEGRDLVCSTHGATYSATDGRCLGGPCAGAPLVRLAVSERDGAVYFHGIQDDR